MSKKIKGLMPSPINPFQFAVALKVSPWLCKVSPSRPFQMCLVRVGSSRIAVFALLLLAILTAPFFTIAYEPTTTHAGLSDQIVEFYNLHYSRKLTASEKELVIRGSMEEDDPAYRALNHFFDPIRNIGFNNGHTAKDWAFSPTLQKYDVLAGKGEQDFSWPRALEDYAKGDEERAFLALGHVIHLLEDMSVPDHTRNDPHKGDAVTHSSPYETWTSLNKNRTTMRGLAAKHYESGDRPHEHTNGEAFFDFVANYSSRNFFSLDTISGGTYDYTEPRIQKYDDRYVLGVDSLLGDLHKLLKYRKIGEMQKEYILDSDTDHSVLIDYFDRLARQDIRAGAGLIHLFLEEAEQARQEYQTKLIEEQARKVDEARAAQARVATFGLFGRVVNTFATAVLDPLARTLANITGNTSQGLTIVYYRTTQNLANVLAVLGFTGAQVAREGNKDITTSLAKAPGSQLTGPIYFVIPRASVPKLAAVVIPTNLDLIGPSTNPEQRERSPSPVSPAFSPAIPVQQEPVQPLAPALAPIPILEPMSPEQLFAFTVDGASSDPKKNSYQPGFGGGGSVTVLFVPVPEELTPDTTAPSAPIITSPASFSTPFATTSVTFSGTAETSSTITTTFSAATTSVSSGGAWTLILTFPQGTTTIGFRATDVASNQSSTTAVTVQVDSVAPDITLAIAQCSQSLATDGCLLATTTIATAWTTSASDVAYYSFSVATGTATTTATTSATTRSTLVASSSTTRFTVAAYDTAGNGATSTQIAVKTNLRPVVINEVAWAGSAASALDEWIELKNLTTHPLTLANMLLESTDGSPSVLLSGSLAADGFYLLERRDNNTVSNVTADLIYGDGSAIWSLRNDGEELRLYHLTANATTTLDRTPEIADCNGWCAGEGSPTFRSMQRKGNGDYDTYLADANTALDRNGNAVFGTPRAANNFDLIPPPLF